MVATTVRRWIDIHLAVLVVLSTLLVSLGKGGVIMLPLAVLAAGSAWWWTDRRERFWLNRPAVNVGIFSVAALTVIRLIQLRAPLEMLVIMDTVTCLQCVLLFERKSFRTWWDLLSLCLLQVCFSADLIQGPAYGPLLVVTLFVGVSALTLIYSYRSLLRADASRVAERERFEADPERLNVWRLAAIAMSTLMIGPLSLFLRFRQPGTLPSNDEDKLAGRAARQENRATSVAIPIRIRPECIWPWLNELPSVDTFHGVVTETPSIRRRFRRRMAGLTTQCLIAGLVVFLCFPRFGPIEFSMPPLNPSEWQQMVARQRRTVGFSDRVRLGEMGAATENDQRVMEIRFIESDSDQPYSVQGGVYLRGRSFTSYSDGEWGHEAPPIAMRTRYWEDLSPENRSAVVRQRISIEALDRNELFCVWPFVLLPDENRLRFDGRGERLHRPRHLRSSAFTLEVGTTGLHDGVQSELAPCERPVDTANLRRWPVASMQQLSATARRWLDEARISTADGVRCARFLESRLRDPARFSYSLTEPERDSQLDPIEDFVARHPAGHCEYFASALALMLRSQGLPARLIAGFRTDDFSYFTGTFRVNQADAHTWVELYVPAGQIDDQIRQRDPDADWSHGAWLRLDPTPSSEDTEQAGGRLSQLLASFVTQVRAAWTEHVLGLGATRRAMSGEAMINRLRDFISNVADPIWWREVAAVRAREFVISPWTTLEGLGPNVWMVMGGVMLGVLLIVFRTRWRSWFIHLARTSPSGQDITAKANRPAWEMYRRLEDLFVVSEQRRANSQTPREYVSVAASRVAELTGETQIPIWGQHVVEAFYQLRYGEKPLDDQQHAVVQGALGDIRKALQQRRVPPGKRER